MSRPSSTIASVPVASVQRYRLQNPVRSPLNQSDPSGAHAAWQIASRDSEPATTVRRPPRSTTNRVASHGMSGWSHSSQQKRPAVRAPARPGDEVRAAHHHLRYRWPRGVETNDRVHHLAIAPVLLLDAQQRRAVRRDVAVGMAQGAR